jgi:hypothetical protein
MNMLWVFDSMITFLAGSHYFVILTFCIFSHRYTNEFLATLKETRARAQVLSTEDYDNLIKRMESMKIRWIFLCVFLCFGTFFFVFLRVIIGSIPFLWLLLVVFYTMSFGGTLGIISLFPQYQKSTSSEVQQSKIHQISHKSHQENGSKVVTESATFGMATVVAYNNDEETSRQEVTVDETIQRPDDMS